MLQRPDQRQTRLLALAEFIEQSDHFDMGQWCHCIAGHAVEMHNREEWRKIGRHDPNSLRYCARAEEILDVHDRDAARLFANRGLDKHQVARWIRNYVWTNELTLSEQPW